MVFLRTLPLDEVALQSCSIKCNRIECSVVGCCKNGKWARSMGKEGREESTFENLINKLGLIESIDETSSEIESLSLRGIIKRFHFPLNIYQAQAPNLVYSKNLYFLIDIYIKIVTKIWRLSNRYLFR